MMWLKRAVLALVALLVLGAIIYGFVPQPVGVDAGIVTRGPLQITIDEEGRTRVRDRYTLAAPVAGELQRITLRAGDVVKAGDTLAVILPLRPQPLDARSRAQFAARARSAAAALSQANSRLLAASAALELARKDDARKQDLLAKKQVSAEEAERAAAQHRIAAADHTSAVFGLEIARFERDAAEAAMIEGVVGGAPLALKAPVGGSILRVFEESARSVPAGAPLIELGDPRALEIIVDVLSSDAVRMAPGARVRLERWGGEGLTGRLRMVEPSGFIKVSALGVEEQRVNAIVDFADPPEKWARLGDGYSIETRIVVWESRNVLKAPLSALFRQGEGWAAFAIAKGHALLKPVQMGRQNGLEAEILGGLDESEQVVVHPGDNVKAGVALEVRKAEGR